MYEKRRVTREGVIREKEDVIREENGYKRIYEVRREAVIREGVVTEEKG